MVPGNGRPGRRGKFPGRYAAGGGRWPRLALCLLRAVLHGKMSTVADEILLFAYGSLLPGEIHEGYLAQARHLGPARTEGGFRLVELAQFPALIASGDSFVEGELYAVSRECLRRLDELKENGRLFLRKALRLESGQVAQAYLMTEDYLRGRRRLRATDWRKRFEPVSKVAGGRTRPPRRRE